MGSHDLDNEEAQAYREYSKIKESELNIERRPKMERAYDPMTENSSDQTTDTSTSQNT